MSLERMFDAVDGLRGAASADAVFGAPREVEGRVLIPVACVHAGMGIGFGQGSVEVGEAEADVAAEAPPEEAGEASVGGGAGGKAGSRPVAIIEVTPEKTIVRPVVDETHVAMAGIVLVAWVVFWLYATLRAIFGK